MIALIFLVAGVILELVSLMTQYFKDWLYDEKMRTIDEYQEITTGKGRR
jgi:hypothetical protein